MTGTTSFVGSVSSDYAVGVASLDPPHLQQTKSEIRSLASEIANLSSASLEPEEFFAGFLPRLCTAMGAESAAVWQTEASYTQSCLSSIDEFQREEDAASFRLIAERNLPTELCGDVASLESVLRPSAQHLQILQCVVAEGSPILVPPGSTRTQSNRPVNPLTDSLIVVPVRVQDEIEYLLEVVQRPSGGPAAQRGYLRFVAQMADLMNDFLRRDSLRQHIRRSARIKRFEKWLSTIAQEKTPRQQYQQFVDAVADLVDAQMVFLIAGKKHPKVTQVSGITQPDPRSETILTLQRFEKKFVQNHSNTANISQCLDLTEVFDSDDTVRQLSEQLACSTILRVPLAGSANHCLYVSVAEVMPTTFEECKNYSNALFGICGTSSIDSGFTRLLNIGLPIFGNQASWGSLRVQRVVTSLVLILVAAAIGAIPVPQQISASAVLTPVRKQVYYAPTSAVVDEVLVNDDQWVQEKQPLLKLSDRKLENEQERIAGEKVANRARYSQVSAQLLQGSQLSTVKIDELESELDQLRIASDNLDEQMRLLEQQASELMIVAKSSGKISSWDLRNKLMNRPVSPGDVLLTTYQPEGDWQLQVSIPEHRVGLINEAVKESPNHELTIRFALTSHPNQVRNGTLGTLSQQSIHQPNGNNFILANARLFAEQLPLKKDGAIARVTVDCGYVPAVWLVLRDAYWAIESRLKMFW